MNTRFLNNHDYIGIIADEAMAQLTRGQEERMTQAEEAAEASILEYLTDNYEVEKELWIGKSIIEYNKQITYPANSHFYHNGKIYEAMRCINGYKSPTQKMYWEELTEFDEKLFSETVPYSQMCNWSPGKVVTYANAYFICREYNGIDFNDIRIPGIVAWNPVDAEEWIANYPYKLWEPAIFNEKFYALINDEDVDLTVNPEESDNWGLIGDYDPDYEYKFDETEYVVMDGVLYLPAMSVNADELKVGYNIREHDPRNPNIKKHMVRLALYELYKLISPNNVSAARITDYETSITWLRDANRCKINPGLPRKLDDTKRPITEWGIATFMRDYDPYQNPWQI